MSLLSWFKKRQEQLPKIRIGNCFDCGHAAFHVVHRDGYGNDVFTCDRHKSPLTSLSDRILELERGVIEHSHVVVIDGVMFLSYTYTKSR